MDIMINERSQAIKVYSPRFYIYEIQREVTLIFEGGNQNSGYHLGREELIKKGQTFLSARNYVGSIPMDTCIGKISSNCTHVEYNVYCTILDFLRGLRTP